jgi:hypothetical protein
MAHSSSASLPPPARGLSHSLYQVSHSLPNSLRPQFQTCDSICDISLSHQQLCDCASLAHMGPTKQKQYHQVSSWRSSMQQLQQG